MTCRPRVMPARRLCVARYGFGFRNCPPELLRGDDLLVDQPTDLPSVLGFGGN